VCYATVNIEYTEGDDVLRSKYTILKDVLQQILAVDVAKMSDDKIDDRLIHNLSCLDSHAIRSLFGLIVMMLLLCDFFH
jgi:hypothetical protein